MANNIAFQAMGKTYQASANTVSQRIAITADMPCNQILVASHENPAGASKAVYFAIGNSTVTVTAPTSGNAQYCYVAVPSSVKVYTVPRQITTDGTVYVAFITESSTAECYFTPGEGL